MDKMGASEEEILDALNLKTKNKSIYLQYLMDNLSKYIENLGLQVRYNPLDEHWFISFEQDVSDLVSANPFENQPKIAATLFCTLACCFRNSGTCKIHEIVELRKKKGVLEDLKILEKKGYVKVNTKMDQVRLTPLIGYELDLNALFTKLALKLKEQ
jgi:hypothetical protein